jgi:hypothetical protein
MLYQIENNVDSLGYLGIQTVTGVRGTVEVNGGYRREIFGGKSACGGQLWSRGWEVGGSWYPGR